jgi:hypothetical protein
LREAATNRKKHVGKSSIQRSGINDWLSFIYSHADLN